MNAIDAIKELRSKTDAGFLECKKALEDSSGNLEKAIEILRIKGAERAKDRSARTVKQGMICTSIVGNVGGIVEILCETDFVANTEMFQTFAKETCKRISEGESMSQVDLDDVRIATKENIQLGRFVIFKGIGTVATYIHMNGKIGILADIEGTSDPVLMNDICMHIAAFSPLYVSPSDIPADIDDIERRIAMTQVTKMGNKPQHIIDKIADGKVNKWYSQVCLMKQPWLRDNKISFEKANPGVKIHQFIRWEVGEES